MITEGISKDKRDFIKKLKGSLSKSEVNKIAKSLKRLKIMPKEKQSHSMRVSSNLMDVGIESKDVILGSLFHDYIERGGDIDKLDISETSKDIIKFLSAFDDTHGNSDNAPLAHLISVFGQINNQGLKDKLVMIKVADRVDNLNRRGKSASKGYLKKSVDLIKFLMGNYGGSTDLGKLLLALNRKLHKKVKKGIRVTEHQMRLLER